MKNEQPNTHSTMPRAKRRTAATALLLAISFAWMGAFAAGTATAATATGPHETAQCQAQTALHVQDDRVASNQDAEHRQGWNVDYPSQWGPEELPVSCDAFRAAANAATSIPQRTANDDAEHRPGWNVDYPSQWGP